MIHIMSTMVVKTIVSRANAAGLYSISADETTDKQRKVDLALGIRYVHEMQAEERVISVVDLQQRDGDFIARVVLNQLETLDLPTDGLVSQTHDGASVMSGKRKGVQAHISRSLERDVPYIRCFAHQLHLVVVWAMKSSEEVIPFLTTFRR